MELQIRKNKQGQGLPGKGKGYVAFLVCAELLLWLYSRCINVTIFASCSYFFFQLCSSVWLQVGILLRIQPGKSHQIKLMRKIPFLGGVHTCSPPIFSKIVAYVWKKLKFKGKYCQRVWLIVPLQGHFTRLNFFISVFWPVLKTTKKSKDIIQRLSVRRLRKFLGFEWKLNQKRSNCIFCCMNVSSTNLCSKIWLFLLNHFFERKHILWARHVKCSVCHFL